MDERPQMEDGEEIGEAVVREMFQPIRQVVAVDGEEHGWPGVRLGIKVMTPYQRKAYFAEGNVLEVTEEGVQRKAVGVKDQEHRNALRLLLDLLVEYEFRFAAADGKEIVVQKPSGADDLRVAQLRSLFMGESGRVGKAVTNLHQVTFTPDFADWIVAQIREVNQIRMVPLPPEGAGETAGS